MDWENHSIQTSEIQVDKKNPFLKFISLRQSKKSQKMVVDAAFEIAKKWHGTCAYLYDWPCRHFFHHITGDSNR